jgi:hypothetical protein
MLALSWARAVSASVGVSWGSVMASTGICCLPGGMLGVGASVSGRFCVLLESGGSGARAMRTNLRGGLEVVAERCWSSSLSLDGWGLGFFVCGCG